MKNEFEIHDGVVNMKAFWRKSEVVECTFDASDLSLVSTYAEKWRAIKTKRGQFYIYCSHHVDGWKMTYLHRLIMNADNRAVIDHINHDTTDNRKINLRSVSSGENNRNRNPETCKNSSGITGVIWSNNDSCWLARVQVNLRMFELGRFQVLKDAAYAVDKFRDIRMRMSLGEESESLQAEIDEYVRWIIWRPMPGNPAPVKGVSWHNTRKKWIVTNANTEEHVYIGSFDNLDDAVNAALTKRKPSKTMQRRMERLYSLFELQ